MSPIPGSCSSPPAEDVGNTDEPMIRSSDAGAGRWVFKADRLQSPTSKGFVGYGDADPSNVSSMVRGAELRIAETRAVNRALRKAYGIGLCSVEELGASLERAKSRLLFPHRRTCIPPTEMATASPGYEISSVF